MSRRKLPSPLFQGRRRFLMLGLVGLMGVLMLRGVWLEVFEQEKLQQRADALQNRVVTIPAYRGMILDRNGDPLAVSSPVENLSCNPSQLLNARQNLRDEYDIARQMGEVGEAQDKAQAKQNSELAALKFVKLENSFRKIEEILELNPGELLERLEQARDKSFFYLGRQLPPEAVQQVMELDLEGVESSQSYRRFYPLGEAAGHILGMTSIDGHGIEGIEKAQQSLLAGKDGKKRVVLDAKRRIIENVESIEDMIPGQSVQLSIDRRIQFIAYRELKTQVAKLNAKSGSLVVLDAQTGEILAMVNSPSFNPNNRKELSPQQYRNRAVTDKSEPGSTLKPLTLAAALESKVINPNVSIDTSPGHLNLGKYIVRDKGNYGIISLPTLLAKSSNVGASRVALMLNPRDHWMFLSRLGLGDYPNSGFPGESPGQLSNYASWGKIDRASHGYGYGLSTSLLQLAHAYAPFAAEGKLVPLSIYKVNKVPPSPNVMSAKTAKDVVKMMESVVTEGTGKRAMVDGYHVAGKTGTAFKFINGKYQNDRYMTSFIGVAPASRPRLVVAVQIDEPKVNDSGGLAAAPVFSKVMAEALRLMDIPPDNVPHLKQANEKQDQIKQGGAT
ncbi:peptidoglycan D,D-transpeptidase FtsI family protein [Thiolinea disciformis]|uniref:peptidoglycan D,D-transpeptidase FtsI family protein n=1 Tax=Thiolinea disciformis TaxID=125614 RepID=UPI0003601DC8|nr:penicillin-binding protein 2 [Thiolinea disciformis]